MNSHDLKWIIIRTIGLCMLSVCMYKFYHLTEQFFSLLNVQSKFYNDFGSDISHSREFFNEIWPHTRELIFLSAMSFYFLKKGTISFNLLSKKDND